MRAIGGIFAAVLGLAPTAGTTQTAVPDLERAYFALVCMAAVQARLDTSAAAPTRTEMLVDQAWVTVEVSAMDADRIQALHAAATAHAAGIGAFHACLTVEPPR